MQPFNIGKLRKHIDKSIPGLSHGFHDPVTWLDTGSVALNYLMAGRFDGGVPVEGKFTMFAGDSGSGKSYIVSANIIKDCQKKGIYPILFDTENSLDESWLEKLGVDTSEQMMLRISAATVDDTAALISKAFDDYKAENNDKPYADRPKMVFIIDSLGMLITPTMEDQFNKGDMKGDMGIKAKQITHMIRVAMSKIASQPIGLLATNHVFDSQDKYTPDKIAGGKMLEFATSSIVQMNKYELKKDEQGRELAAKGATKTIGIWSKCVVRKSRYAKPFEDIRINIPYAEGMDRYSGCFDLFSKKGLIEKVTSQSYSYTSRATGEVHTSKRDQFRAKGIYDLIIEEHPLWEEEDNSAIGFGETDAPEDDEE